MNLDNKLDGELDPDRTLLIPTPGGRRTAAALPPQPVDAVAMPVAVAAAAPGGSMNASSGTARVAAVAVELHGAGLNPLVRAANPLLDLVVPLRFMASAPDMEALRQRLMQAVQGFEAAARASHADGETVAAARYALCTFLDETISSTPWGGGVWNSRSLLVAFTTRRGAAKNSS